MGDIYAQHTATLTTVSIQPLGLSYQEMRQPLWEIHEFVRQVLASHAPGFRVTTKMNGEKTIEYLALGRRYYKEVNKYLARIPSNSQPAGFVGLFLDCCYELKLFHNPFHLPGTYHRPEMIGAETFNALLKLIRKRSHRDKRCKDYLNFAEDYDIVGLKKVVGFFDYLFLDYSKILVVRVDLGYQADEAGKISFERAHRDIQRFINYRKWHACFEHCIGYVTVRERGTNSVRENGDHGRGYHFHCLILFNGQKVKDDVDLARRIIDYWENRIVNTPRTPEAKRIKTWFFNCNAHQSRYQYNGIGMVQHSDELKRWHMIFALIYLMKCSQGLGDDVPPGTRSWTKGEYRPQAVETRGRPRQLVIQGEKVRVQRLVQTAAVKEGGLE